MLDGPVVGGATKAVFEAYVERVLAPSLGTIAPARAASSW